MRNVFCSNKVKFTKAFISKRIMKDIILLSNLILILVTINICGHGGCKSVKIPVIITILSECVYNDFKSHYFQHITISIHSLSSQK